MNDLLTRRWVQHIVGVIDLLDGQAVHAIAGNRNQYQPIAFCNGDPLALVAYYRTFGLSALYVADLDAIENDRIQGDGR